jgi:glycosyltransferase involved in cell wall biosynthesis
MKIAIDVHSLGSRSAGNETYFRQLLRGLVLDKSENQYTLFYTHAEAPGSNPVDARFRWVRIPQNPLRRIVFSLPQVLRKLQPDVFHCQYIQPPLLGCRTAVAIHDLAHEHYPEHGYFRETLAMQKLVRSTARRADRIITVSRFSADDISRTYGVPPEKIAVTYPAVSERFQPGDKDSARLHLARKYGLNAAFLLYVGRIQARKNLVRLVEAYARLRQRGMTHKLVLVGKRDYGAERLFAKIDELGLRDEVIFPGHVFEEDLMFFYQATEAFVFPSLFEGFGLPVLESMASGIPTITSRGSSLEEVAGDAALLVDPLSVDALADAMERVLTSEELRRDLSARGLRRSAEFKLQTFAAQTLQVYNSLA